jgi:hypothetical protein
VLACILGLTALVGMGLTIGGVVSDNNLVTAIGLTMVAIPALISGGMAIASFGAWGTMAIGVVTAVAGVGTGLFAYAEYQEAFTGKLHPCGRCSKNTGELVKKYAKDNEIPIIIFGDMLATGSQCINLQEDSLYRLNLPASLSVGKQEIKSLIRNYDLKTFKGFGCPLLYEVHRKFPYHKKFSIQRILRETRSGALEPGEALDLIWSFYKTIFICSCKQ